MRLWRERSHAGLTAAEFDAAFELESIRSERSGHPLSLVVFTMRGDEDVQACVEVLCTAIEERKRQYDTVGLPEAHRIGVLLPYTGAVGARAFAEDVLQRSGLENGRAFASVSSNEGGLNGIATPESTDAPAPKIEVAVPEEVAEEAATPADAPTDSRSVASIWHEFQRKPSIGKRTLDIAGSGAALVVLSPVLITAAALVKWSSPGPILFAQQRAGQFGRPFMLLKFRSMYIDAEARKQDLLHLNEMDGPVFKIKNDPRITPVGRWLRRWSIDELPQFYNVLRGDMSLVGPRPPTLDELPGYETWHLRRLTRRGGLTCIWQTSGRNNVAFQEWMRMDMRYMRRQSIWTDISLIAKTVWTVATGHGAS